MHHPTDRITHTTPFVTSVVEHWLEREIGHGRILVIVDVMGGWVCMRVYVCMYVCMCVYMYVCVCIDVCVFICMCV